MEFYHLLNRGVEKRETFSGEADYVRFLHNMYMFNSSEAVDPNHRFKTVSNTAHTKSSLVEIHAFCLMGNHYHMLVSEKTDGGISTFMRKLNMGYAKYFNEKYNRTGVLWQGTFRKILVKRDAHFLYIPYYIHLNPLDISHAKWRTGLVNSGSNALAFLKKYRWSSFLDYFGIPNFPSLLTTTILSKVLGSPKQQEKNILDIISNPLRAQRSVMLEE